MFNTVFVVLLYGKKISDSVTLKNMGSILQNVHELIDTKVIIWNNGPKKINMTNESKKLISELRLKFNEVQLIDIPINNKLSYVYNECINNNESYKYVFLDDDSSINASYISDCINYNLYGVVVPTITCDGVIQSPYYLTIKFGSRYKVAIGSGLLISKGISTALIRKYGSVFDDRYYLYGVDTSFFLRLHECNLINELTILNGFEHDLSRLTKLDYSDFRRDERSADIALTMRFYLKGSDRVKLFIAILFRCLKDVVLNKKRFNLFLFLRVLISGIHHRELK